MAPLESTRSRSADAAAVRRTALQPASSLERSLCALGTDPRLADAVLGDLAEEFVERTARDGRSAALSWSVAEAMRSVPYVVRNILWRASPTRLAGLGAATALGALLVVSVVRHRAGAPALLVPGLVEIGGADGTADLVVNGIRPVRVPVQVRDAAGHRLAADGVRYRWESGTPLTVSDRGAVTCTRPGDATVRATLGELTTRVAVRCRPVRALAASRRITLVAGEPARPLSFHAVGVDGRVVTRVRGSARVVDSSVAKLVATAAGASLRPRRVGETTVAIDVGESTARSRVVVHEPVRAFTELRPAQRLAAVFVRLARGETARLTLPEGDSGSRTCRVMRVTGRPRLRSTVASGARPWRRMAPMAPMAPTARRPTSTVRTASRTHPAPR